jgi:hypothetical protein
MSEETVTGRTYTATRVRGFAPWSPRTDTLTLLDQIRGIFREYSAQLPLTNRQIFYRLVGAHGYDKTEKAYSRLCETLNRARRANLIPFSYIRDDGTISRPAGGWRDPAYFWDSVRYSAENFRLHKGLEQPVYCELWVEASGMVPQAAAVAHDYGISVYSAGGFNGLTDKYETAQRLAREMRDRPVVVLHVGDYDPSGCAIIDSLAQDIKAFTDVLEPSGELEFRRIVVTPEQIDRFELPTAPQKVTDRRGEEMDETVQAEALPPDVLADEIREACEAVYDHEVAAEVEARGDDARAEIISQLPDLGGDDE